MGGDPAIGYRPVVRAGNGRHAGRRRAVARRHQRRLGVADSAVLLESNRYWDDGRRRRWREFLWLAELGQWLCVVRQQRQHAGADRPSSAERRPGRQRYQRRVDRLAEGAGRLPDPSRRQSVRGVSRYLFIGRSDHREHNDEGRHLQQVEGRWFRHHPCRSAQPVGRRQSAGWGADQRHRQHRKCGGAALGHRGQQWRQRHAGAERAVLPDRLYDADRGEPLVLVADVVHRAVGSEWRGSAGRHRGSTEAAEHVDCRLAAEVERGRDHRSLGAGGDRIFQLPERPVLAPAALAEGQSRRLCVPGRDGYREFAGRRRRRR